MQENWLQLRDAFNPCDSFVLATIVATRGSTYRKTGTMMLIDHCGNCVGLLSGGCLESDIATNARKVMQTEQALSLCYDGSDEDDLSFHLGIGCGGTVYIMLQPISATNDYLALTAVYQALDKRVAGYYYQSLFEHRVGTKPCAPQAFFQAQPIDELAKTASIIQRGESHAEHNLIKDSVAHQNQEINWLASPVIPEPHILVVGGGIDARPLVSMAQQLGWQVSLWDPRPANARKEFFTSVNHIIKGDAEVLATFAVEKGVNAAVLMSHNIEIDAQALAALSHVKLQYLALLGPKNRRQQVVEHAKVDEMSLAFKFAGPSGLNIGGTLPESIALSILSECHASLYGKNAQSLSEIL